jgi:hypothetical protein
MKAARLVNVLISALLLLGGCRNLFMDKPAPPGGGEGTLLLSFREDGVTSSPARTILPEAPEFTHYELEFLDPSGNPINPADPSYRMPLVINTSAAQLHLAAGEYTVLGRGYTGDTLSARSEPTKITIIFGVTVSSEIVLRPYAEPVVYGFLNYSLTLEGITRVPAQVDLLIETYTPIHDGVSLEPIPAGVPIPAEWMVPNRVYVQDPSEILAGEWDPPGEFSLGSEPGTVLLLNKARALQNLSGSLSLPPGEYLLTMRVSLDGGSPVKRTDIAQVYSGLTSSGFFHYGGGDITLSGGGDIIHSGGGGGGGGDIIHSGGTDFSAFITRFTFAEYPDATSVVGGRTGADGTRLIMVVIPANADRKALTALVETAPGASVSSPLAESMTPVTKTGGAVFNYPKGEIDFSNPTLWTAVDKYGATQDYTVVVSQAGNAEKTIDGLYFQEFPGVFGSIDQITHKIEVILPHGARGDNPSYNLTPVFSIIGKEVRWQDDTSNFVLLRNSGVPGNPIESIEFKDDGGDPPQPVAETFRVIAGDGSNLDYTVTVSEVLDDTARITQFAIDGYPDVEVSISGTADLGNGISSIKATLPYGVSLENLKPLIQYEGKSLYPPSGALQDFSDREVPYTVMAENGAVKGYRVILKNASPNTDTGIFNFIVTNVPNSKVVIGRFPRPEDGKIPIVIQVPFGTNEKNMIPAITLANPKAKIAYCTNPDSSSPSYTGFDPPTPSSNAAINFGNVQEAYYRVTAEAGTTTQDYVVLVSEGIEYYYVNGVTGRDDWPDYYNGGSESHPFKTLAKAVYEASREPSINKIFVSGELNNSTEQGAYAEASSAAGFHATGGSADSVFNLIGTNNKQITVTGVNDAVLRGTSGKRVLSITGNARLVFENITVTGGDTGKDGGGLYITGDSKVKFSGGMITGNKAASGGGVYIEDTSASVPATKDGEFSLIGGSISGNTATGSEIKVADNGSITSIAGGGGLYVNGYALAWLAGGTIANNTTQGSGGGVLINGKASVIAGSRGDDETGLLMSGGSISQNKSTGAGSPHGGGGVYVASGAFDMQGGEVAGNYSKRQGGGVFVWHDARYTASGNSSILNNDGVGSSKAICSRGLTEMRGNAKADKVYIWNNPWNPGNTPRFGNEPDSFTIAEYARADGIVLAYDDTPGSPQTRNYIDIKGSIPGTDPIATIDLEGHLTNYVFATTDLEGDWLNRSLVKGSFNEVRAVIDRFPLGAFVGSRTLSLGPYKLGNESGNYGKMLRK